MPNGTLRDVAEIRIDDRLRRVVQVRGSIPIEGGDFPEAVRGLLAKHGGELGLGAVPEGLQVISDTDSPVGRVVRYRETRDGIPVYGTEILVASDTSGRVTQMDLTHHAAAQVVVADAALSAKDAVKAATAAVEGKPRLKPEPPEQVYYPVGDALRLAYRVLVPTTEPVHDWEVVVDAASGEVLSQEDLIAWAPDGSGLVFDPNPVVSAGTNTLRDPSGTPATCGFTGTPQATIDAQRVTRTLRDLTLTGGTHRLDGPFCRIVNFANPAPAIPEEATASAFTYPSDDPRFEAVNVYYHVDSFQRYLQSLGVTNAHNSRIDCDPHDNSGGGGAFFSPADGGLHFGDSGTCRPDRAEDGDVMIHEYGHAIQRNMVPTWGTISPVTGRRETRAMGEGYGDILAALYFSEANGGFQREVFEDWIFGPGGLRRVDGTKTYPTDWANQEHADGEIWSAALWNAYRAMGGDSGDPLVRTAARDAMVKTLTLANLLTPGNGTMPDGAEAVLRTNAALDDYLGRHCMAMLDSFHARGILPVDAGADLYISDQSGDAGTEATAGAFWNSPDLWIRNGDDDVVGHQPPEFGQDNWFYARVTNRGTATARAFVVTFNVKTFAGTEFVYPNDFLPPISAAVGFNLAPGASTVVKAKWPAGKVPAAGTHACWLASVHTPTGATAAGRHVWESNNLAQKNLAVVDLVPGDAALVPLQVGNLASVLEGVVRLEIVRPRGFEEVPVTVEHRDPRVIDALFESGRVLPTKPGGGRTVDPRLVKILDPGRIEIPGTGGRPVRVHVGGGSLIELDPPETTVAREVSPELTERLAEVVGDRDKRSIAFGPGRRAGFPIGLRPRLPVAVGVRVEAPKSARAGEQFAVDILQRNAKGDVVGGVTVQVNVR